MRAEWLEGRRSHGDGRDRRDVGRVLRAYPNSTLLVVFAIALPASVLPVAGAHGRHRILVTALGLFGPVVALLAFTFGGGNSLFSLYDSYHPMQAVRRAGIIRAAGQVALGRTVAVKTLKHGSRDPRAMLDLLREAWVVITWSRRDLPCDLLSGVRRWADTRSAVRTMRAPTSRTFTRRALARGLERVGRCATADRFILSSTIPRFVR